MLLAIDTSTSFASIALVDHERIVVELGWEVGQRHSTELLQRLDWLFDTAHVEVMALDGIAVATGPGSFNGVRVAVATAKALAFAHHLPLYGHSTLDVIGWGQAASQRPVWAMLDAGRGQIYAARYATPAESAYGWAPVDGYHIVTPVALVGMISRRVLFCGEWREETRTIIRESLGTRAWFVPALEGRRASWLAQLALARAARGTPDSMTGLEPVYLRRPAITTSAKTILKQTAGDSVGRQPSDSGLEGVSRALRG